MPSKLVYLYVIKKVKLLENPNSLSSNQVLSIFKDSKKNIWIGTGGGGLNRVIDKQLGTFKVYNTQNKFPTNHINNIEEDKKGTLWLSSDLGLIKFNPTNNNTTIFDKKDGLQGRIFNDNVSFNNNSSKTLYFGGVEGLSYFNPLKISQNNIPPQIAFTNLYISNKRIKVGEKHNGKIILKKPLAYQPQITLSYNDDDFTIEFSALHFESTKKNQYKYMLVGFDKRWKKCSLEQSSARYTNLKKGNFIFKVKAANPDNVWNKNPIELAIKINPPFYNTIVFYLFIIILLVISVIIYIKLHTKKLQKTKKNSNNLYHSELLKLKKKHWLFLNKTKRLKALTINYMTSTKLVIEFTQ